MTVQLAPADNTFMAPTNNSSLVFEASRVVKVTAGILFGLTVYNSAAVPQFIQLHDSATVPGAGAIPSTVLFIPAGVSQSFEFGVHGRAFNIGIVVCNSSTAPTRTAGAADCFFDPRFK